jgi:hypothetical protein
VVELINIMLAFEIIVLLLEKNSILLLPNKSNPALLNEAAE